ncbi:uncharacterized protein LOC125474894 [Pyrus x bretschneideri]|uniref:uncharacterized protein LOC125474894 n=1 Tax=Pyrus x bretschneideri TaxID=225117 RepID=UPI00202E73C5|nr:uncharacterized protein LOC125474894 [Pyrus x bretschneideri]
MTSVESLRDLRRSIRHLPELWNLQWLAGNAVYHVQRIREGAIPSEELHLEKVVTEKKWREVGGAFMSSPTTTSALFVLRKHYLTLVYHYKQVHFFRHRVLYLPRHPHPHPQDLFALPAFAFMFLEVLKKVQSY